jgi:hypothetical protein
MRIGAKDVSKDLADVAYKPLVGVGFGYDTEGDAIFFRPWPFYSGEIRRLHIGVSLHDGDNPRLENALRGAILFTHNSPFAEIQDLEPRLIWFSSHVGPNALPSYRVHSRTVQGPLRNEFNLTGAERPGCDN